MAYENGDKEALIQTLKARFSAVADHPEDVDLSGTPFTRVTSYTHQNDPTSIFQLYSLGNEEQELPKIAGCFWEVSVMTPGKFYPHIHDHSTAHIFMIAGRGIGYLDREPYPYDETSEFVYPAGMSHGFDVQETTIFLACLSNPIVDPETKVVDFRDDEGFEFPSMTQG